MFLEEGPVIAMTHKTDFLTLSHLLFRKPEGGSFLPDIGLLHFPHGEQQAVQPRGLEAVEEITLILAGISPFHEGEVIPASVHMGIMAGCYERDAF